jgi:starch phosphorylase
MPSTRAENAPDDVPSWWKRAHGEDDFLVAYFSPEFGVDAQLPVYSGGLGVLAGDHLKAAGDLGVPLLGVGLFYGHGYFRQSITQGRQRERYPELGAEELGLTLEREPDGQPLLVDVELAGETIRVRIWRRDVRGSSLYLLDSNVEESSEAARRVTDVLYGGDREHRIRQEIVLGVGGARTLRTLGLTPSVYHLNEGHAAFLALERIRALVGEDGLEFDAALDLVRGSTVFTTHTPVPAGNERFDLPLAQRYLEGIAEGCGIAVERLLDLGRAPGDDSFGLTPLALRTATFANGVSALHGSVSRRMWHELWPEIDVDEVPIGHVTNAVHAPTWVSQELQNQLTQAGVSLAGGPDEQRWERALDLGAAELWGLHLRAKERLVDLIAERSSGGRLGGEALDPDALTIGFARRFAAYKRASLLFANAEAFVELLSSSDRPVQFVFAGKAHPADNEGKGVLADVVRFAGSRDARGRVAFVPDYDMALAGALVQGVDVWLNTPRPPYEASGTSGMKAALNGVLNLSVLDGWWPEAYSSDIGWAIPAEASADGDEAEAEEVLRLLAHEVAPIYYDRDAEGFPVRWVEKMRAAIGTVGAGFNGARMVADYVERFYLPVHRGRRIATGPQPLGLGKR